MTIMNLTTSVLYVVKIWLDVPVTLARIFAQAIMKVRVMSKELFRIVVDLDVALCGENQTSRRHFGTKTRRKNAAKKACKDGWIAAGRPKVDPKDFPVRVDIITRRAIAMDDANVIGAVKSAIDSLFAREGTKVGQKTYYVPGLVTPDDSIKYLRMGTVEQEVDKKYKEKPQLVFVIMTTKP